MEAKHTPGPWKLSADSDETMNPAFLVTESNTNDWPSIVAEVNSEANARLISAAPELLDALRALHRVCMAMDLEADHERPTEEAYLQATAQAAQAIANATGQEARSA